jgi:hypothetical protein
LTVYTELASMDVMVQGLEEKITQLTDILKKQEKVA